MKHLIAWTLVLCLIVGLMPTVVFAQKASTPKVFTEADYTASDDIWEEITRIEDEYLAKKAPAANLTQLLMQAVRRSDNYVEGSLQQNGEHFIWKTDEGIVCGYSPALREKARAAKADESIETIKTVETVSFAKRGGSPVSSDVYLFQPYYGMDEDFTEQYYNEGLSIANALGGNLTTYRTTSATVDNIADAIESGAVVIFDSHGDTDYANGEDYTTYANSSYICLQVGTGLTSEDYEYAEGEFAAYAHAFYGGSYGSMRYYCVDGTAIANHMDKNAENSLVWMALCLGMATDGMHKALREKGVEVVYGYTQNVTFDYDYMWEECFWNNMVEGKTVAESIAAMKSEVGLWDWCHSSLYDTIAEARAGYCAFPIVVSDEDVYPGHGNVDALQTVRSTWTLLNDDCEHASLVYFPALAATCTSDGNSAYYYCTACTQYFTSEACTQKTSPTASAISALGHNWNEGKTTVYPSCTADGIMTYTCTRCPETKTQAILALGHNYENNVCTQCGAREPQAKEFVLGESGEFVIAANVNGTYYALPNTFLSSGRPSGKVVEVTDGYVLEDNAANYAVELSFVDGKYTISNGSVYLSYVSSTNLSTSSNAYLWTITEGTYGSWRVTSQTSSRALIFRAGSNKTFGGYSTSNFNSSSDYFDVEILPIGRIPAAHTHNLIAHAAVAPTCESDGNIPYWECTDCGAYFSDEAATNEITNVVLEAWGHEYSYTPNGDGTHTAECENEHSEVELCVYVDGICELCGASEGPIEVAMTLKHTLQLGNDISIKYGVVASDVAAYDSFYLVCNLPIYEGNELIGYEPVEFQPDEISGGVYLFVLEGITAKMMNDDVISVVYMTKDGKEYCSTPDTYSIAKYAYNQLNKASASDSLKAVCANLLRYGAMAQSHFTYRTDALVDAKMTEDHKAYLTDLSTVELVDYRAKLDDIENPTVTWKGITLELGNKVIINYAINYADYNMEDLYLKVSYVNNEGNAVSYDIALTDTGSYWMTSFEGLIAPEMRTIVSAAVYHGNTRVSQTYEYSIETYAARSKEGVVKQLCTAMIAYGDCASAYFAN